MSESEKLPPDIDTNKSFRKRLWDFTGFKGKTLWDLVSLIFVPLVLAGVAFGHSSLQETRQTEIEETRIAAQSTIEADRIRANAPQAYLNDMSIILLLEHKEGHPLYSNATESAKFRTESVLSELDRARNLDFIHLIDKKKQQDKLISTRQGEIVCLSCPQRL